jgi:hypothetical protein
LVRLILEIEAVAFVIPEKRVGADAGAAAWQVAALRRSRAAIISLLKFWARG